MPVNHMEQYIIKKVGSIEFASNFSFYYAHYMSTIERKMVCTNNEYFYQMVRMFRSHGMLRENTDSKYSQLILNLYSDLNPEFIFTIPGYNRRSTELKAVFGLNQLKLPDKNIYEGKRNFQLLFKYLNVEKYFISYKIED